MPSSYLLTDIFLRLDAQLGKKVFRPTRVQSRTSLAANEGVKAKRLIGSLRALWRSSPDKGQDAKITELKSFLQASPKPRLQPDLDGSEPDEHPLPEAAGDLDLGGHQSDVAHEDDGASEDGRAEDGDRESQQGSGDESEDQGKSSGSEKGGGDDGDIDGDPLSASQQTDDAQGTPSTLRAPTLKLDFPPASPQSVPDSDSESGESDGSPAASNHESIQDGNAEEEKTPLNAFEAGDSQVQTGSGWMGRAIMNFNSGEFGQKYLDTRDHHYNQLMSMVRDSIAFQLGEDMVEGGLWDLYDQWCRDALIEYGDVVFEDVIKGEFFRAWARRLKSQA